MSIESFVSTLRSDGVPSEVSSTVYSYYESFMLMRRLILSPADRRYDLFGSTDEDLLDDARLILRRLRIASTEEELARFATTRPDLIDLRQPQRVTLGDVARFVTAARERLGKYGIFWMAGWLPPPDVTFPECRNAKERLDIALRIQAMQAAGD